MKKIYLFYVLTFIAACEMVASQRVTGRKNGRKKFVDSDYVPPKNYYQLNKKKNSSPILNASLAKPEEIPTKKIDPLKNLQCNETFILENNNTLLAEPEEILREILTRKTRKENQMSKKNSSIDREDEEIIDIGSLDDQVFSEFVIQESPVEKRKATDESVQSNKKVKVPSEYQNILVNNVSHQEYLRNIIANKPLRTLSPVEIIEYLNLTCSSNIYSQTL